MGSSPLCSLPVSQQADSLTEGHTTRQKVNKLQRSFSCQNKQTLQRLFKRRNNIVSPVFPHILDTSDASTVAHCGQNRHTCHEHPNTGTTNKHWVAHWWETMERLIPEYFFLFPLAAARHPCRLLMRYRSSTAKYKRGARNKSKLFLQNTEMWSASVGQRYLLFLSWTCLKDRWEVGDS